MLPTFLLIFLWISWERYETTVALTLMGAKALVQIIGYLEPLDLLQLARTDKQLRVLLMNRAMSSYWKRARRNVEGLPPCPRDLSDPAYANLMFTGHCHVSTRSLYNLRHRSEHIFGLASLQKCFAEDKDVLTHLEARVQLCHECTLEE